MAYKSIDELQTLLSSNVFGNRQDSKKAAGRALGTFIETIMFYLLRQWKECDALAIERPLAEYGRSEITHNVEFTLHPILHKYAQTSVSKETPLTARNIASKIGLKDGCRLLNNKLINKGVLQNGCVIGDDEQSMVLAGLDNDRGKTVKFHATTLSKHAYAMIECKRVGKEGDAKGPQTIEKAKQGAYVAKTTSSLQKIRNDRGELDGVCYVDGKACVGPYEQMLNQIIYGDNLGLLKDFTLSIGVVSNHGNWFSSDNMNKELKVLAQSYDWLLFLTDEGLSQFITDLLLAPQREYSPVRNAFISSYGGSSSNVFTKKKMDLNAHYALCNYFDDRITEIEDWFNVISPKGSSLQGLKSVLETLRNKRWEDIL